MADNSRFTKKKTNAVSLPIIPIILMAILTLAVIYMERSNLTLDGRSWAKRKRITPTPLQTPIPSPDTKFTINSSTTDS